MRYFTSDLHLGSALINKYAHRPFASAEDALKQFSDNIIHYVHRNACIIHVGDFMLDGADRHGVVADKGLDAYDKDAYLDYIGRALGYRFVLLAGNHDDGHNCEADCTSMVLDLNQKYRNVYVNHFPSGHKDYHGPRNGWKHNAYDINLCGHVHDAWLVKWDAEKHVLNINVGVDVWDYKPVRDAEITDLLDYFMAYIMPTIDHTHTVAMTRHQFDSFKLYKSAELRQQRLRRKEEKLKKKGLTPEECERRKMEALKKKGLLK